jgi:hypothetical protein
MRREAVELPDPFGHLSHCELSLGDTLVV